MVNGRLLWLSEAIEGGKEKSDDSLEGYIFEPFPDHEFEQHGWRDILASFDVCAIVNSIKHCDEEGYDLVSMNMANVVLMEMTTEASHKLQVTR